MAGFEEVDTAEVDVLAVAVFLRGIRLIDHILLGTEMIPGASEAEE